MSLLSPPPPSSTVKCRHHHRPSPSSSSTATSSSASSSIAAGVASNCAISQFNSNLHSIHVRVSKEAAPRSKSSPLEPHAPFSSLALRPVDAPDPDSASLTYAVGSSHGPQLSRWHLDRRHILLFNLTACVTAISASWLFFSAIPALLAFKKAAESLEKLLDVTAEELPDTMAAIRLSGMEISDLTMELSDLGQGISQGVRSSTRAVHVAEERLRCLTRSPTVSVQNQIIMESEKEGPVVAQTARNLREGIVKGRAFFGLVFSIIQASRWAFNFLASRGRKKAF